MAPPAGEIVEGLLVEQRQRSRLDPARQRRSEQVQEVGKEGGEQLLEEPIVIGQTLLRVRPNGESAGRKECRTRAGPGRSSDALPHPEQLQRAACPRDRGISRTLLSPVLDVDDGCSCDRVVGAQLPAELVTGGHPRVIPAHGVGRLAASPSGVHTRGLAIIAGQARSSGSGVDCGSSRSAGGHGSVSTAPGLKVSLPLGQPGAALAAPGVPWSLSSTRCPDRCRSTRAPAGSSCRSPRSRGPRDLRPGFCRQLARGLSYDLHCGTRAKSSISSVSRSARSRPLAKRSADYMASIM